MISLEQVLDAGKVVEFDEPYNLLQKENFLLFDLVSKTGPELSKQLHLIAKEVYQKKHGTDVIINDSSKLSNEEPADQLTIEVPTQTKKEK